MTASDIIGRSIVITREEDDAEEWASRLSSLGARPIVFPCLVCEPIHDGDTRDRMRVAVHDADWLVVTSRRGALAAADLLNASLPARVRIAAVGPTTARAVDAHFGREPALVATGQSARGLGQELAALLAQSPNKRVVVAGAAGGRRDVEEALAPIACVVTRVDVYRTMPAPPDGPRRDLTLEAIDDVWLASPSAVRGLLNRARLPAGARIITIGATTTAAVHAAGLTVAAQAAYPDFDGFLEAM